MSSYGEPSAPSRRSRSARARARSAASSRSAASRPPPRRRPPTPRPPAVSPSGFSHSTGIPARRTPHHLAVQVGRRGDQHGLGGAGGQQVAGPATVAVVRAGAAGPCAATATGAPPRRARRRDRRPRTAAAPGAARPGARGPIRPAPTTARPSTRSAASTERRNAGLARTSPSGPPPCRRVGAEHRVLLEHVPAVDSRPARATRRTRARRPSPAPSGRYRPSRTPSEYVRSPASTLAASAPSTSLRCTWLTRSAAARASATGRPRRSPGGRCPGTAPRASAEHPLDLLGPSTTVPTCGCSAQRRPRAAQISCAPSRPASSVVPLLRGELGPRRRRPHAGRRGQHQHIGAGGGEQLRGALHRLQRARGGAPSGTKPPTSWRPRPPRARRPPRDPRRGSLPDPPRWPGSQARASPTAPARAASARPSRGPRRRPRRSAQRLSGRGCSRRLL